MAVTATTPPLTELPPPPLPTDAEATFDAKAGASLTAQVQMVTQINVALTWQAASMAATLDYKNAASASASQAALAASTASLAKDAAQQAVTDTTNAGATQVGLAIAAKNESQAAAIAAGAAAGLPGDRVPFTVLQISSTGQVAWGYGLPDRTNAKAGYSLMLGTGKVPTWGYIGDQIGDILTSSRNPGSLYLPALGGIYLKATYPALASILGNIGTPAGRVWALTTNSTGNQSSGIGSDGKGVWIRGNNRSADNGLSFTPLTGGVTGSLASSQAILSDGNQTWMAAAANSIIRSLDNGAAWAMSLASAGGQEAPVLATDKLGTWIYTCYSNIFRVSRDNGVTWGDNIGLGQAACFIGNNTWITNNGYRSVNGAQTWAAYGTSAGSSNGFTNMLYLGSSIVLCFTSAGIRRTTDGGLTWNTVNAGITPSTSGASMAHDGSGNIVAISGGDYSVSSDYGASWFVITKPFSFGNMYVVAYGNGKFISSGANGYASSVQTFDYDPGTQFKVPTLSVVPGIANYIKALEIAP